MKESWSPVTSDTPSSMKKFPGKLREIEPWQGTKRLVKFLIQMYVRPQSMEERLRALGVKIGSNVQLQPFTLDERYARLLTIEDDASIGKGTVIYLSDGAVNTVSEEAHPPPVRFGPVRICKGAVVTRDVIILCGVTIGAYAIVGAGSLVANDVAPHTVVMGVPSRKVCTVTELIEKKYNDEAMKNDRKHFYIYMPGWRQRRRIGMTPEEQDLYYYENFTKHGY